jgi:hypothetical protein
MPRAVGIFIWAVLTAAGAALAEEKPLPQETGYRGIWYMNQPTKDEYRYKYSGGFATYPQQHEPIAIYSKAANKTFFCYGGTTKEKAGELLHMVSYYDHATGTLPRPALLLNKQTDDAHDNPTLALDAAGYVWVFSNSHGTSRPSFIHRSVKPYDISAFELIQKTNFSYSQPWFLEGRGFVVPHTRYTPDHDLFCMTSRDGREWSPPQPLAAMAKGHYQISWPCGPRLATAFDHHPDKGGLNARTNLYYLETADGGSTWKTAAGVAVALPLKEVQNAALVHDYQAEHQLVYLKDLNFDAEGRPVILFLTSGGFEPGPKSGPRVLRTARWTGAAWEIRPFTEVDHNYDHGSLYIEGDGAWRVIAPTDPGPQPDSTGGEVCMWLSRDQGQTWKKLRALTPQSKLNHTYVRRPLNAHPDFYAFWADGNPLAPSECRLYFTNQSGEHVWRLPAQMDGESAKPEVAW